jgi:hypothetical protein
VKGRTVKQGTVKQGTVKQGTVKQRTIGQQATKCFRAGCGREREGPADLADLAYTDLAFAECPACPHRLEPEGGPAFCRWLSAGAPHPFAALAGWTPGEKG